VDLAHLSATSSCLEAHQNLADVVSFAVASVAFAVTLAVAVAAVK